jgi:HAD superfamily hydrolase (TIGR01509 family)
MSPAAVLWDMDGTLVEEDAWEAAHLEVAEALGGTFDRDALDSLIGASFDFSVKSLLSVSGQPPELYAYVSELLIVAVEKRYKAGIKWLPGAKEALNAVSNAGIPQALVTNTIRRLANHAISHIGRHRFVATVCGDEVLNSKPAPDPYIHAASLLGVPIAQCLVIEDSSDGLLSAVRSGAIVTSPSAEYHLIDFDISKLEGLITS